MRWCCTLRVIPPANATRAVSPTTVYGQTHLREHRKVRLVSVLRVRLDDVGR